ncbi:glutathione S-transferase family protein [uncultured Tistrella sp.]|uniref:glutathione S-transferase family protein n=1 Tax=Tistrella mobilis TaxID=171437 RepID=UPI000C0A950D|nr:glutathione S-transferase family protein [uncultured Tistrella sp.]MAM75356.1 glutathione S-transferase [Tistrella sp.]
MLTLYHCHDARSFRPLWTLEELAVETGGPAYELKMLPFPPRVFQKSYLEINPLGTIPALFDEGKRMTESAAICQYLVTRHGPTSLAVAPDEADYGPFLNFLHFGEATLTFPQTLVLRYRFFEPDERKLPQAADDYAKWFLARLRLIEQMTGEQEYLCAGRFTAADISVGYAILLAHSVGLAGELGPNVRAYWERLSGREGFKRAKAVQLKAAEEQGVPVPKIGVAK